MNKKNVLPRKLWILWYQGFSDAPLIVKICIESWINKNPGWDVIILNKTNINNYITLDVPKEIINRLNLNHQSDLVRLALLSKYGGVWADATTFCINPLDEWIDDYANSGFFVFSRPTPDKMISSWFIASEKECPLVRKLYERLALYWRQNSFNRPTRFQFKANRLLVRVLNRSEKTTKYWFSPVVTKILRVYPYFVIHYMFERLISQDVEAKKIWDNTYYASADGPALAYYLDLFSPITNEVKEQIDNNPAPLYKFDWRCDNNIPENSVLSYITKQYSSEQKT